MGRGRMAEGARRERSPTAWLASWISRAMRSRSSPRRASSGALFHFALGLVGGSARRSTQTALLTTSPTCLSTPRRSASRVEDEEQRAKVGELVRPRAHVADAARARSPRPPACVRTPGALDEAVAAVGERRPLHLHLHLRHDRAAEGLHDPRPQLLRHGGDVRHRAGPARGRRHHAHLLSADTSGRLLAPRRGVLRATRPLPPRSVEDQPKLPSSARRSSRACRAYYQR